MGLFRGLNLLQAVEAQSITGAELEIILVASPAKEGELGALLSTRHMARRMAGNPITMAAINSSASAIKIVFERASKYNSKPVEEVANNAIAMSNTSKVLNTLNAVADNDVSWQYYSESVHYPDNVVNTLATLIGLDSENFTSLSELILVPSHMGDIASSIRAMKALVASPAALAMAANSTEAMGDIFANLDGARVWANSNRAMRVLSNSEIALEAITDNVRLIVSYEIPSALMIISANYFAWNFIVTTSTTLHLTATHLLRAINGLDEDAYATIGDMFADPYASSLIANSRASVMVVLEEPAALAAMLSSPNLETILGYPVAMAEMVASESIMNALITNVIAFPLLLGNKAAKSVIFASPTLFSTMMTPGSVSLTTLKGMITGSVTVKNNSLVTVYKSMGISGNIIIITAVMGSIVATKLQNYFRGTTQAAAKFGIPGTSLASGPIDVMLPFTDVEWDIESIAATAAADVTITYVDFN
jgi:hypothetical protein